MPADRGASPDPAFDAKPASGKQAAVRAGGCFWRTEAVFEAMEGVNDVVSGYCGGTKETAKYDIVSTGRTGRANCWPGARTCSSCSGTRRRQKER